MDRNDWTGRLRYRKPDVVQMIFDHLDVRVEFSAKVFGTTDQGNGFDVAGTNRNWHRSAPASDGAPRSDLPQVFVFSKDGAAESSECFAE